VLLQLMIVLWDLVVVVRLSRGRPLRLDMEFFKSLRLQDKNDAALCRCAIHANNYTNEHLSSSS
jgi:hypothetical protein